MKIIKRVISGKDESTSPVSFNPMSNITHAARLISPWSELSKVSWSYNRLIVEGTHSLL